MTTLFDNRPLITPRDYQQEAIDNTLSAFDSGVRSALIRQPTGSGKTVTGSLLAEKWIERGNDHKVLVLAHERQLIQQFAEEIHDILGISPAIEMGEQHSKGTEDVIVGSRQTLYVKGEYSRLYKFRPTFKWLLICDEAHRWKRSLSSCKHIIEWFDCCEGSRRLGLTATPERSDKVSVTDLFSHVSIDYRLFDPDGGRCAVLDGWAVPYDQRYVTVHSVDFDELELDGKDFDANDIERKIGSVEELRRLIDPTIEIAGSRQTIIYSATTKMARDVAMFINGISGSDIAISVDGTMPDTDRKVAYAKHKNRTVQFLSVCSLCREGYNDPNIGCVAIFRPTKSRSLAEQMKGRGCRPIRGCVSSDMTKEQRLEAIANSEKPNCIIVDLVGATGLGDVPSTVELMAEGKPDQVIQLAKRRVLEKGLNGPVNVADEIRRADEDIKAERERLEMERRAKQAEMSKLARLNAKTSYSVHSVDSNYRFGSLGSRVKTGGDFELEFGKFKGKRLRDCPIWYLRWLAQHFKGPCRLKHSLDTYRNEYRTNMRRNASAK